MATVSAPAAPRVREAAEAAAGKIDFRQIYFNAVLGGCGGLLGWMVMAIAETAFLASMGTYTSAVVKGLILGVCIGFAIGSVEGLVASQSLRRLLRGGLVGALIGALGGLIGLPVGEFIFNLANGGVWPRAIGWAIFGLFIGASDGFAWLMPSKIRYGLLGGLLGGLIGGSTFERIALALQGGSNRAAGLAWGSAFGLIILGACIGALIGLVESLLRKSFLFFITGRLEGQTRTLDSSRPHTLGSSPRCTIVLPGDLTVQPLHAEIAFQEGEFVVRPRDGAVIVKREGKEHQVTAPQLLKPGDRIHLGDTRAVYRGEKGNKS